LADKETSLQKITRLMYVQSNIRNIATSAHIHHGKTAMTDNLIAAAGKMAAKYAGNLEEGMMTWQHEDEQTRLLTVDAANVSLVHDFDNKEYLINLIDTPGHVDFGGNVTRAMRAIDGTIVLVCASEGIMPQTETVLKQALKERVKPVLFINKVDRLIKELRLTPEQIQEKLMKILRDFNKLIENIAEPEFKEKWKVNIMDGSVVFGSARDNWALSIPFMKKKGITFKDISKIYSMNEEERRDWCWENAPLYEIILDMVIKHLPNPAEAQKYRISKIWHGDPASDMGKSLMNCDPNGKLAFVITRIIIDPKTGRELSVGRLFSGTMRQGAQVYLNTVKQTQKVQQVLIYDSIKPEQVEAIPAGNVIAVAGISSYAGETLTSEPDEPFEELRHIFEPVITKAIEPANPQDLPKMIEVLRKVSKEDPSIKVDINEETGESLIHGMGELHLEIIENRIITEKNVKIKTSQPIVVYRESITKKSPEVEGKSPNKHNKFYIIVEPVPEAIKQLLVSGEIPEGPLKKKEEDIWKKLIAAGMERDHAKRIKDISGRNIFMETTKGIVHIGEVLELCLEAYHEVMKAGPLAREPCFGVIVNLVDCSLHEDSIHRGPAQVIPAVRDAIKEAMINAGPVIFEPVQTIRFDAPYEFMGDISKIVQSRRGQLLDVAQEESSLIAKAKMPVAEMFGLADIVRSATEGRGSWSLQDSEFEKLPSSLQEGVVKKVRERKGLTPEQR